VLTSTYNQVNARLQALRFRSNQDGAKWKRAVKEHEKMIEALSARDTAAMRVVLLTHLHNKRDVVIDQLRHAAAAGSAS
jgi:DNA-binding GntR family transcriptional regulator